MDLDVEPAVDAKKTGHRWMDIAAATGALIISVVSLWVAITNGHTNKQLVAANSWPFLQMTSGNSDEQRNPIISLAVQNAGVGPAKVETFEVFWGDKPMKSSRELLRACCSYPPNRSAPDMERDSLYIGSNRLAANVIRPGDSIKVLLLPLPALQDDAAVWHRFDTARFKLRFRACYCSVFDECWVSDLVGLAPKPVRACPFAETAYDQ
jgi:hypothetical protein